MNSLDQLSYLTTEQKTAIIRAIDILTPSGRADSETVEAVAAAIKDYVDELEQSSSFLESRFTSKDVDKIHFCHIFSVAAGVQTDWKDTESFIDNIEELYKDWGIEYPQNLLEEYREHLRTELGDQVDSPDFDIFDHCDIPTLMVGFDAHLRGLGYCLVDYDTGGDYFVNTIIHKKDIEELKKCGEKVSFEFLFDGEQSSEFKKILEHAQIRSTPVKPLMHVEDEAPPKSNFLLYTVVWSAIILAIALVYNLKEGM